MGILKQSSNHCVVINVRYANIKPRLEPLVKWARLFRYL